MALSGINFKKERQPKTRSKYLFNELNNWLLTVYNLTQYKSRVYWAIVRVIYCHFTFARITGVAASSFVAIPFKKFSFIISTFFICLISSKKIQKFSKYCFKLMKIKHCTLHSLAIWQFTTLIPMIWKKIM